MHNLLELQLTEPPIKEELEVEFIYTPPYSPDFNLVEYLIPLPSVWGKTLIFRWLYPRKLVNLSESDRRALSLFCHSPKTFAISGF